LIYYFWFKKSNKLIDIDECLTNNGECSVNAICSNTIGSFTCACQPGYSGEGKTCNGMIFAFFSSSFFFKTKKQK